MTLFNRFETELRPRVLMDAAMHFSFNYNRKAHLKAILHEEICGGDAQPMLYLRRKERSLETMRIERNGVYRISEHVLVLGALLAELRKVLDADSVKAAQV